MYTPRLGWTYWIILHLITIPLTIYIGSLFRRRESNRVK
ncbi:hypothetical protein SAMN05443428_10635 [Caloramator quimbayensis]|uniref:Uncharacterized protein n=1 Tax=Caloramator quimbayensis TaxID=1147123 RepID=A0A1T4X4J4_9CLOT|nr:hypothetical protein SAMN05443428_10635 [Caloramator quimbayensis]